MKVKLTLIFFILIASFLLISCTDNKFTIGNIITPKISFDGLDDDEVGLEYNLGPLLILDVIYADKSKMIYLKRHMHDEDFILDLVVEYTDCCVGVSFSYYMKGNRLNNSTSDPISAEKIIEHSEQIPGFVWLVRDGTTVQSISKSSGTNYKSSTNLKKLE